MDETSKNIIWHAIMTERDLIEFQDWLGNRIDDPEYKTEYEENRLKALVCCPHCLKPVQPKHDICPSCSTTLDNSMIESLRDSVFELAAFGLNYREVYEKDLKRTPGKLSSHYLLNPPEGWMIYLASIIFAAVIGGLSYDAFKRLLSKLRSTFKKHFGKKIQEASFESHFNWAKEYINNKFDLSSIMGLLYVSGMIQEILAKQEIEEMISSENLSNPEEVVVKGMQIYLKWSSPDSLSEIENKADAEEIKKELHRRLDKDLSKFRQLKQYMNESRETGEMVDRSA